MKTIYVNSRSKYLSGCMHYMLLTVNSMNARRVIPISKPGVSEMRNSCVIKTRNLTIYIFPRDADMTWRRDIDEAFYFDEETSKYLYGNRYSQRYIGSLIDYIAEVEGGIK